MRRRFAKGAFAAAIILLPRLATAQPFVYVANAGPSGNSAFDDVTVINAATNGVATTIAVGDEPRNPGVSSDGTRVYVPNRHSDTVTVIDGVSNTVITTITDNAFDEPYSAAVSPDGSRVYVANKKGGGSSAGSLTVIDGTNNTVITTITDSCFDFPEWVTVNPAGTRAYVVNRGGNSVCVVNTGTNTVVDEVSVGREPRSAVVTCNGAYLYVANNAGATDITKVRTSDNTVVGSINFGTGSARNLSITPDGTKIYVGLQNSRVGLINTLTDAASTITVSGASSLYATAVAAGGLRVYATDEDNDRVEVIDVLSGAALTGAGFPIAAGDKPRGVATQFSCAQLTPAPAVAPSALLALLVLLSAVGLWTLRRRVTG